jgi:hypothetical protein
VLVEIGNISPFGNKIFTILDTVGKSHPSSGEKTPMFPIICIHESGLLKGLNDLLKNILFKSIPKHSYKVAQLNSTICVLWKIFFKVTSNKAYNYFPKAGN